MGGMENEIRERLVKQLQDSGHADVQTYCGPKQVGRTIVPELAPVLEDASHAELLAWLKSHWCCGL